MKCPKKHLHKHLNEYQSKSATRRLPSQAMVAFPSLSIALVVSLALALTPFVPSRVMALDAPTTPTETAAASATPSPTTTATASATPSATPSTTPSPTTTATASATPSATPSPTTTATASATPSATPSPTTTATASATSTASASATSTASASAGAGATPSPTPGPDPSSEGTVTTVTTVTTGTTGTPATPGEVVTPVDISLDHHVLARIESPGLKAAYLPVDSPVLDASQLQTYRVRFQLRNAGTAPITATPQLEYRPTGADSFVAVPVKAELGVPFYVDREWVPSPGIDGGTVPGPLGESIAVGDLRIEIGVGANAVSGRHSMGANPDAAMTLPPDSFTEQEFTVRLSLDAKYLTGYELRITDRGTPLTGTHVAGIRLGERPEAQLSAGQRQGVLVGGPTSTSGTGARYPLLSATSPEADPGSGAGAPAAPALTTPTAVSTAPAVTTVPAVTDSATPLRYALASGSLRPAVAGSSGLASAPNEIHGPYSMTADQCATCHRGHTAQGANLLKSASQSTLCFSCHDTLGAGAGAGADVQGQYALARPANNPVTREYYSHDAVTATTPTPHTRSELDEFGGQANRHSECADCHNPHKATSADSTQTLTGWTASGRLAGLSGVSVVNGAAGTSPVYTFRSGVTDAASDDDPAADPNPIDREYQLCFKCHSGSTTLTSNAGLKPSQYALDKAVELNPNNPSTHPVEAAGKNTTAKMAISLAGTSPYKLWNFTPTSTIRCLNCHASSATPGATPPLPSPGTAPLPLPGSALAPHTSSNRGILLRPYRDRELKSAGAAYSAGDFALCYVCHAEEPFAPNGSASATNFREHARHLTELDGRGDGGTDIDTAGAGAGNAICAECHFRIHSTTNKVGPQVIDGSRLLNFAPNVTAYRDKGLSWTPPGATGGGSCTLTCHGKDHDGRGY